MKTPIVNAVMKGVLAFSMTILIASCGMKKTEDSKEVAEEHNEAKFDKADEKDAQFLVDVADMSYEEIDLGKLAQMQGTITDVKELGQLMMDQHTALLSTLQQLASSKNITLPTSLSESGAKAHKNFAEKHGKEFDKAYCDKMVAGHKKAIGDFETIAANGTDKDIRAFATNTLSSLRMHLDNSLVCQAACNKK